MIELFELIFLHDELPNLLIMSIPKRKNRKLFFIH